MGKATLHWAVEEMWAKSLRWGAEWTQRSAGLLLAVGVNKEGAQNKLRVRGAKSEW